MSLVRSLGALSLILGLASLMSQMQIAVAGTPDTGTDLLLEVVVNGQAIHMIGEFHSRHGKLFATRQELTSLGFLMRNFKSGDQAEELPLAKLPRVTYRLDEQTQTVYFTAANSARTPTMLTMDARESAHDLPIESSMGATANYNIVATHLDGQNIFEGELDTRVFSRWGVVTSSSVATAGGTGSTRPMTRLDTVYSYSDPDSLFRYRAGDVIQGGLAWTRPVRLGGVQITTDFSIRPDLVTFPVPTISGQVAVPSSVDVLVNGVQLLSRDVPPGPFQIQQLPIVTGAGDISVVVHNALGQETSQTLPIYASTALLARGLSSFSAELGEVRLNYGLLSNDYHAPAGSFTYRYGLLDWLTLEGHGEASAGGHTYENITPRTGGMAGGGIAFTVGHVGVLSLDGAASSYGRTVGSLVSLSYERVTPVLSLAGSIQAGSHGFGDIASSYGDPVPSLQLRASAGLSLGRFGSVGVAYTGMHRQATAIQPAESVSQQISGLGYGFDALSVSPQIKVSLISATFSRQAFGGRAYFYATAYHDFANPASAGAVVGITIPFGRRGSSGIGITDSGSESGANFQASEPASSIGDIGWNAMEDAGKPSRQLADVAYKSPWSLVDVGVDRVSGQSAYHGTAQGALTVTDGAIFASNTIYDSFAVVDTDGMAGLQVLQENRPVGHTGESGLLLVPDLRAFDANRLSINPEDVPVDAEISQTSRMIRPQDHSGVIVHFPVHSSHGALLRLTDKAGVPLPPGSSAELLPSAENAAVVVGYDGEAYVTGLHPDDTLLVTLPSGRQCTAVFHYKAIAHMLPEIGPIGCRERAP